MRRDIPPRHFVRSPLRQGIIQSLLLLAIAACSGDSPVTTASHEPAPAATLMIMAPDSLGLGEWRAASAQARDALGRPIGNLTIDWSSAHEDIVRVNGSGTLTALRPGAAVIRARSGNAADSVWIHVVTSRWEGDACGPASYLDLPAHGFYGSGIVPGHTMASSSPSGHTEYHGIPFFYASGFAYGTHPDTMLVGYDWHGGGGIGDFSGGICEGDDAPHHTMTYLHRDTRVSPGVRGVVVTQEQFAWDDPDNDDYVLFRYRFTNTGADPVTGLHAGVIVDYDMYGAADNVGLFDAATGVAYTVARDSLTRTLSAAAFIIGRDTESYFITRGGEPAPTRRDYYNLLAAGTIDTGDGAGTDVRQLLGAAPLTIARGQTETLWYVLAVGADRAALEQSIAAARAKVSELE